MSSRFLLMAEITAATPHQKTRFSSSRRHACITIRWRFHFCLLVRSVGASFSNVQVGWDLVMKSLRVVGGREVGAGTAPAGVVVEGCGLARKGMRLSYESWDLVL